jgi:hypothetical protein
MFERKFFQSKVSGHGLENYDDIQKESSRTHQRSKER